MRYALHEHEIIDIAARTARRELDASNGGTVVVVEREPAGLPRLVEVSRVARADDNARHPGLIEHPANRDRADTHAVARRHLAEHRKHVLEALPSAELVDDQPVLHQRSILERRGGIGAAQVAV